jgi:general stress protein YciG
MVKGREPEKGKMTVQEAGHKGGERTAETHGPEFYSDIGRKGGKKGGEKTQEEVRRYEELKGKPPKT